MEERKDLTVAGVTDVAPADMFDGRTGLEELDRECFALPYLRIAQPSSGVAKPGDPKYIRGITVGEFFNPSTQEVYGNSLNLVVVKAYRNFSVYESKEQNAKWLGTISTEQFKREVEPHGIREKSYTLDPQGHRYVDCRNFVVINYDHPEYGPFVFSMSSTGIKPSKAWASKMQARGVKRDNGVWEKAPMWATVWNIETDYFPDPRGGYYQVKKTDALGWVKKEMGPQYREIFDSMQDAEIKAEEPEQESGGSYEQTGAPAYAGKPESDHSSGIQNERGPAGRVEPEQGEIF